MTKLRPGDRFEAEVYRIREMQAVPRHIREDFRIVSLCVSIPNRVRTYFTTVSWNLKKLGREPRIGDDVTIEYVDPPFPGHSLLRGKFRIVHMTGSAVDDACIGTVTWEPNHQAVYCRVQVDQERGTPLAIKATFSGFDHKQLTKGTRVEVARSDKDDARRYHIVRILKAVEPKGRVVHFDIECRNPCGEISAIAIKETQTMNEYNDRVRFFLGYRYLQSSKMYNVLDRAFGLDEATARDMYRTQSDGFYIICRPDQFARFMIYRNNAGIQNGFMDLKAELVLLPEGDVYSRVAKRAGVDRCAVKKILLALNYDTATIAERLEARTAEIDVSNRN